MASTNDEIIAQAAKIYGQMSLQELLAQENIMAKLSHMGRLDNTLKKLYDILRSEIEAKLR